MRMPHAISATEITKRVSALSWSIEVPATGRLEP